MVTPKRKGAARVADVPAQILKELNGGQIEAATLVESLATDFNLLLSIVLPDVAAVTDIDPKLGITKRMVAVAAAVTEHSGSSDLSFLSTHPSDLARGWGAYVLAATPDISLEDRIERMRPFADDLHFGVREWSWLALRPYVVKHPKKAMNLLESWVTDPSTNIRRFAIEVTRPRGVWSAHIPLLKAEPELARTLLDPLSADPSRYVQDSVGNWLNDAWKTSPQWVENYCTQLESVDAVGETLYIIKRALRNKK